MKIRFYAEVMAIGLYYSLMSWGYHQALMGQFEHLLIAIVIILGVQLLGRPDLRTNFNEISPLLLIVRRRMWYKSPRAWQEQYFAQVVVHCVYLENHDNVRKLMGQYQLSLAQLAQIVYQRFANRMEVLHSNWENIAYLTYVHYREVDNMSIFKVEEFYPQMIYQWAKQIEHENWQVIIEGELFNNFMDQYH